MAETMRERIARALCAANGRDPDELAPDHMMEKDRVRDGNPARRWEDWTDDADAVLAAMREPTEAMIKAAFPGRTETHLRELTHYSWNLTTEIWQAMIDAALEEK